VDSTVLENLDVLLHDASALRDQMLAGQRDEQANLARITESARAEAEAADRAAARADAAYADALSTDDPEAAAIAMNAAKLKRAEAQGARTRLDAALDSLASIGDERPEDEQVMRRLWEALSSGMDDANGDLKLLNAVLRETFEHFTLTPERDGLTITPVLHVAAVTLACERVGYEREEVPPTLIARNLPAFR
jgi:hypothetical protein